MKVIAALLCIYLSGLCIQPAVFPLVVKERKVMACCKKDAHHRKDCSGKDDKCCNDGLCNPFFSQCPVCAATAVLVAKYTPQARSGDAIDTRYFTADNHLISNYCADILRPPRAA